jgi:hypothetical protein
MKAANDRRTPRRKRAMERNWTATFLSAALLRRLVYALEPLTSPDIRLSHSSRLQYVEGQRVSKHLI